MRLSRVIRHQLDKLPHGQNRSRDANHLRGKWRVVYPDQCMSDRMYHDVACAYAELFGGHVLHIDDAEEGT